MKTIYLPLSMLLAMTVICSSCKGKASTSGDNDSTANVEGSAVMKSVTEYEIQYEYDAKGNQVMGDTLEVIEYTYNEKGLVTEERYENNPCVITYTYDDNGRLTQKVTDTDGESVTTAYHYNDKGQLFEEMEVETARIVTYEYDDNGRVTTTCETYRSYQDEPCIYTSFVYDANGNVISKNIDNEMIGEKTSNVFTYDKNGNLLEEHSPSEVPGKESVTKYKTLETDAHGNWIRQQSELNMYEASSDEYYQTNTLTVREIKYW